MNEFIRSKLNNNPDLFGLDDVVEKEILHHDIMYVLHKEGILQQLTFIGGTSLRLCYNSNRLSEDLDFTAGKDFTPAKFDGLETKLKQFLANKYGLAVSVRKLQLETNNTSTWKITIEKHSERPDLPSQKMHIDVCAIPSFDVEHRPLIDHYQIGFPMSGLPIPVQSMKEILADKMVAFAYRERRIKPRDIWDITWLKQQGVEQDSELVLKKLVARSKQVEDFLEKISLHASRVATDPIVKSDFEQEMQRFLPVSVSERTLQQSTFWPYLSQTINEEVETLSNMITKPTKPITFSMKM